SYLEPAISFSPVTGTIRERLITQRLISPPSSKATFGLSSPARLPACERPSLSGSEDLLLFFPACGLFFPYHIEFGPVCQALIRGSTRQTHECVLQLNLVFIPHFTDL